MLHPAGLSINCLPPDQHVEHVEMKREEEMSQLFKGRDRFFIPYFKFKPVLITFPTTCQIDSVCGMVALIMINERRQLGFMTTAGLPLT